MSTDPRQIVDQHLFTPAAEVGRILVDAGHMGTWYMRPANCIIAYWLQQRSRIASGELDGGCPGECQPWTNAVGRVLCRHTGQPCVRTQLDITTTVQSQPDA